jgi:uncharacterized protein with ATP-grasp and redox domains
LPIRFTASPGWGQTVGNGDPYRAAKQTSTGHALALYPRLKTLVAEASDPLDVAVRLSIADVFPLASQVFDSRP